MFLFEVIFLNHGEIICQVYNSKWIVLSPRLVKILIYYLLVFIVASERPAVNLTDITL